MMKVAVIVTKLMLIGIQHFLCVFVYSRWY